MVSFIKMNYYNQKAEMYRNSNIYSYKEIIGCGINHIHQNCMQSIINKQLWFEDFWNCEGEKKISTDIFASCRRIFLRHLVGGQLHLIAFSFNNDIIFFQLFMKSNFRRWNKHSRWEKSRLTSAKCIQKLLILFKTGWRFDF